MNKKYSVFLFSFTFLIVISAVFIFSILTPDRKASEFENRNLAQIPSFNWSDVISGNYFQKFETYLVDQLAFRDALVSSYIQEKIESKEEIKVVNNIVILDDGFLFQRYEDKSHKENIDISTNQLNRLSSDLENINIDTFISLAPNRGNVLSYKVPKQFKNNISIENRDYFLSKINDSATVFDTHTMFDKFPKEKKEELFFKTDHHWNINGAYLYYQKVINELSSSLDNFNEKPLDDSDFDKTIIDGEKFVGSFNRQLNGLSDTKTEKAPFWLPKSGFHFNSFTGYAAYVGTKISSFDGLYGKGISSGKLNYPTLYLDDYSKLHFTNEKTTNDIHLLIVKDSYANAIIPFFASHFKETTVLDLRHYKSKTLYDYAKDNSVDAVLFIYNDANLHGPAYNFYR